jgi:hypothetical protein
LIFGLALLFSMPGISTLAVRPSRSATSSIGKNKVSQNSEQVDAKTEKKLLNGLQALPEIIVSTALRCVSSARSSMRI